MPWNEPGSGNQNPWGKKNKGGQSPDLEDVIQNVRDKFSGNSNGGDGFSPLWLIFVFAFIFWGFQSFYIVQEGYQSVVLRLGKYIKTEEAGLKFIFWPIEKKIVVNTQTVQKVTVGYREQDSSRRPVTSEGLMLTNDENIIEVWMEVQYNIKNVKDLLFNVGNIEYRGEIDKIVRGATESALREVVGSETLDNTLTEKRVVIDQKTAEILQDMLDRYKAGINITNVLMQDAKAPEEVGEAFADVVKADQDQKSKILDAQRYENKVVPEAKGIAERIKIEAEAYKQAVIANASGEAKRFDKILTEYRKAPEVTRKRLYIETMENVLSKTNKVIVDQDSGNSLMYLPIDKMIKNESAPRRNNPVNDIEDSSGSTVINETDTTYRNAIREGR